MRRARPVLFSLLTLVMLFATACSHSDVKSQLAPLYASMDKAVETKDLNAFQKLLHPTFLQHEADGNTYTRREVVEQASDLFKEATSIVSQTTLVSASATGDQAHAVVDADQKIVMKTAEGKTNTVEIRSTMNDVWTRVNNNWELLDSRETKHERTVNGQVVKNETARHH